MKKFRRQKKSYQIYNPKRRKGFSRKERIAYLRLVVVFIILIGFSAIVYLKGIDFIAYYSSLWQNQSPTPIVTPESSPILSPQLNPLPLAIKEDEELKVSGRLLEGTQVIIRVNAQEVVTLKADAEGKFETTLKEQLNEGANTVSAIALNQQNQRSKPSASQTALLDTQPPELEVTSPEDGVVVENSKGQISITGKTESSKITVSVNDSRIIVDLEGSFSYSFHLSEGENTIMIKAEDEVGHETAVERTVTYQPSDSRSPTP